MLVMANILNKTVMSAGFRAPLDSMAPSAWPCMGVGSSCPQGQRDLTGLVAFLLGEALDFLSDPAHCRTILFLLGQHGHHGLCVGR